MSFQSIPMNFRRCSSVPLSQVSPTILEMSFRPPAAEIVTSLSEHYKTTYKGKEVEGFGPVMDTTTL